MRARVSKLWQGADRGSAEAIGTILSLATLLIFASLAIPALGVITDASALSQQYMLEFEGQRVSSELQTVDQLVRSSDSSGPIARYVSLPEQIGNEHYTITVSSHPNGDQWILLQTNSQELSARVLFVSETPVENTTLSGGDLHIIRPDGSTKIVVRSGVSA